MRSELTFKVYVGRDDCESIVSFIDSVITSSTSEMNVLMITHKPSSAGIYQNMTDSFGYKVCTALSTQEQLESILIDMATRQIVLQNIISEDIIDLVPVDRQRIWVSISSEAGVIFTISITLLGISLLCVTIYLLCFKQKRYEVRASSPALLGTITLGCLISYASVFMFYTEPTSLTCMLRPSLMLIGFAIAYGALFFKNLRILLIFKSRITEQLVIGDFLLFLAILFVVIIYMVILVAWSVYFPLLTVETIEEPFMRVSCGNYTSDTTILLVITATLTGLWLIAGIVISFQTRKLPELFKEGMWIGFSVYTITLIAAITLPIAFIVSSTDDTFGSVIICMGITVWTTGLWAFIFFPKIRSIMLISNKEAKKKVYNRKQRSTLSRSSQMTQTHT
eukprot:TRINITY_DN2739_c1_g1_i2.p1 TRINITY_DN2739_c1_g1~~TRINITY_DN2739_c1_g1_i2.p1  ORF type:complete len:394 (-),score=39.39 TRINITY_DN2739_c1_g1_i2:100-1281(-)